MRIELESEYQRKLKDAQKQFQQKQAPPAPFTKPSSNPGVSSWNRNPIAHKWQAPGPAARPQLSAADLEKKRSFGSIIVKTPGYQDIFATKLVGKKCPRFHQVGEVCLPADNCRCEHSPFDKWDDQDKMIQVKHVEKNKKDICFNKAAVRSLAPEHVSLLGTVQG